MNFSKISKDAGHYATYRGFGRYAEDFGQFVCEELLKGRKTNLKFSLVDFLRKYHENRELTIGMDGKCEDPDTSMELSIKQIFKRGEFRVLMLLLYHWGFTQKELSELYGVTEGRISQQVSKAQERMKEKL